MEAELYTPEENDPQTPQYEGNVEVTLAELLGPEATGSGAEAAPVTESAESARRQALSAWKALAARRPRLSSMRALACNWQE